MTELLKFVEALATKFASGNSGFLILLKYYGTEGRKLQQHTFQYHLFDGAVCSQPQLESRLDSQIFRIGIALEELVHALLVPIYEQFDFTELPRALVNNVVRDAFANQRC